MINILYGQFGCSSYRLLLNEFGLDYLKLSRRVQCHITNGMMETIMIQVLMNWCWLLRMVFHVKLFQIYFGHQHPCLTKYNICCYYIQHIHPHAQTQYPRTDMPDNAATLVSKHKAPWEPWNDEGTLILQAHTHQARYISSILRLFSFAVSRCVS